MWDRSIQGDEANAWPGSHLAETVDGAVALYFGKQ